MRQAAFLLVFVTGCSTAPCADFLDHFCPARVESNVVPGQRTRGGVCDPQTQSNPTIGPGNPANTPTNPAVAPGAGFGGPPVLPTPGGGMPPGAPPPGMAPGGMTPGDLPQPTPPSPPGPAIRF